MLWPRPRLRRTVDVDHVLSLLYPSRLPAPLRRKAVLAAGSRKVEDLATVRRILGALDRQAAPSPVSVRFGRPDLVEAEVHGITLVLDRADTAVSRGIIEERHYEPHLTAVFERFCGPGMTVLDVGSNVGFYTMLASKLVGPTGRVCAFDPNSENCRLLLLSARANVADNVEVFPVALAESTGWSYFSPHEGSNGGLLDASIDGGPVGLVDGRGSIVPTFRLDDLVPGPVHFMKLDVEGAEGRVVAGARRLLEAYRPVVTTELSGEMLARVSRCSPREFLGTFVDLGYALHLLDRAGLEPEALDGPEELLARYTDPLQIENILLLPPEAPPAPAPAPGSAQGQVQGPASGSGS